MEIYNNRKPAADEKLKRLLKEVTFHEDGRVVRVGLDVHATEPGCNELLRHD